jgi:hypothetical protein
MDHNVPTCAQAGTTEHLRTYHQGNWLDVETL